MSKIKAILTEPKSLSHFVLGEIDPPLPGPSQALVRVKAISLNRGEVRGGMSAQNRYVPGWDLAGVVEQAAADGSGPKTGKRVVGRLPVGAWAELVAVPTFSLAELPDKVSFSQAASLPVAGLTALAAIKKGGSLLARNVVVTGASGGVGMFAVALARLSGATVVGLIHHPEFEAAVCEAGASHVVAGEDASGAAPFGPYDLIVDGVGGAVLASAAALLAPGGVCVTYGAPQVPEITFSSRLFFAAPGAIITGLILGNEEKVEPASVGLKRLAALVADGRLHPHIDTETPWEQIAVVAQRLMDRQYAGKAVLLVS
jgi:NADPH2:quinone reductase